ncbi:hypothetical protein ACS0TY_001001 [Phlomoides rotata]
MRVSGGGGERRYHESEWIPVRQKRSCSYPYPSHRIDKVSELRKNDWTKVWNPNRGCVTYFFVNFPEDCSVESMFNMFSTVGVVRDVFIPNKRNKKGQRYGFLRFGSSINRDMVEKELNNIWFGSFKLRANLSKFERRSENKLTVEVAKSTISKQVSFRPNFVVADKSFVEALKEKDMKEGVNICRAKFDQKFAGIQYTSDESDKEFLKGCYTGCLKESTFWPGLRSKIQEICEGKMVVKYLGGDLTLLQPVHDAVEFGNLFEDLQEWFEFIRPWKEGDISNRRLVWTKWFGVPLHAWNPKFFNLASTKFGAIMKIDDETLFMNNLYFARILIRTPLHEIPKAPFPIAVDGKVFYIRVKEETEDFEDDGEDWSSDGSKSEEWGSEKKYNNGDVADADGKIVPEVREFEKSPYCMRYMGNVANKIMGITDPREMTTPKGNFIVECGTSGTDVGEYSRDNCVGQIQINYGSGNLQAHAVGKGPSKAQLIQSKSAQRDKYKRIIVRGPYTEIKGNEIYFRTSAHCSLIDETRSSEPISEIARGTAKRQLGFDLNLLDAQSRSNSQTSLPDEWTNKSSGENLLQLDRVEGSAEVESESDRQAETVVSSQRGHVMERLTSIDGGSSRKPEAEIAKERRKKKDTSSGEKKKQKYVEEESEIQKEAEEVWKTGKALGLYNSVSDEATRNEIAKLIRVDRGRKGKTGKKNEKTGGQNKDL